VRPILRGWLLTRRGKRRGGLAAKADAIDAQLAAACHPLQLAYAWDPSSRVAALTAGRGGKTTAAKVRLIRKGVRIARARLLFVATSKDAAEDLIWESLKELLAKLSVPFVPNESKLRLRLTETGALIQLVGADDKRTIERLRGRAWHEVIIDEGASYPPALLNNLITKIIGPRLGDFGGQLLMQGTPGNVLNGLFYDVTRPSSTVARDWARRDEPEFHDREAFPELIDDDGSWLGWSTHRWNLIDAAKHTRVHQQIWEHALREKKRNGWSDKHPTWLREYMGVWAADDGERMYHYRPHVDQFLIEAHPHLALVEGAPWNLWTPKRDELGWAILPPTVRNPRHAIGMDLGHGAPFCLQVLAYDQADQGRNIWHRYEFHRKGMYARKIAELLLGEALDAKNPAGVIGAIGGWPDRMVADLANLGDAIILELSNVYGIPVTAADKKSKPGNVELTNGDLIDGRMHVLDGSVLAQQMAELQWRVDEFGLLKEPKHGDDACDGVIYPRAEIAKLFEQEAPAPPPALPRRQDRILEDEQRDFTRRGEDELLSADYYDEAAY
jgi:hypothetical protein